MLDFPQKGALRHVYEYSPSAGFFTAALRIIAAPVEKALALRVVVLLATLAGAWPACQAALLAAGGDQALLSVLETRCSVDLTQGATVHVCW